MEGRGALADCYGHKNLLGVAYATLPAILIDGQGTVAWARSPQVPQNHRMSPSSCSIFIFITTPIIYMRCLTHLPEPATTPDLHITADIITVGFVRTGSDVPSQPVMSLKMKK